MTYTATDANVQELSKNGFNVELNADSENNMGTALQLGARLMKGTDWYVTSESFPQQIEETLVEIQLALGTDSQDNARTLSAYQIMDSVDGQPISINPTAKILQSGDKIYGFYSCHIGHPARYQFIYLGDAEPELDDKGIIINKNVQYFIDGVKYQRSTSGSYDIDDVVFTFDDGTAINTVYNIYLNKGKRYNFAPESAYNPVLKKYVNKYIKSGVEYEGYTFSQTVAPSLITNYIANHTEFKSPAGWGTIGNATVELMTDPDVRTTIAQSGIITTPVTPYLKCVFPSVDDVVVNSSFTNFRKVDLVNFSKDETYVLLYKLLPSSSATAFTVTVKQSNDESSPATYLTFSSANAQSLGDNSGYMYIAATIATNATQEELRAQYLQTYITCSGTLNIVDFQLFPRYLDKLGHIITPFTQGETVEATTNTVYRYYNKAENSDATSEAEYKWSYEGITDNSAYKPKYSSTAEQVHDITVQDSNYFNGIQSICSEFQCWADFQIDRDENGAPRSTYHTLSLAEKSQIPIDGYNYQEYVEDDWVSFTGTEFNPSHAYRLVVPSGKMIHFSNFIGKTNYAGIKYGVNLSNVSRSYDSNSLVSKLIVKDAVNEFAPNGFCSIARSKINATGESSVIDFSYYINQKLIDKEQLERVLNNIVVGGDVMARGVDLTDSALYPLPYTGFGDSWNCYGYKVRLMRLNAALRNIAERIISLTEALTPLKTEYIVLENMRSAAILSIQENANLFKSVAKFEYTQITVADDEETKRRKALVGLITLSGYPKMIS